MRYTKEQELLRRAWSAEVNDAEFDLLYRIYSYNAKQLAALSPADLALLQNAAAKYKGDLRDALLPGARDLAQQSEDRYFQSIIDHQERDRY